MVRRMAQHQRLPAARRAGNQVSNSPPFEWLSRAGFVSRGLVYLVIGVLAAKLALGVGGGRATDQEGALKTVAHQPFGKTLLAVLAAGLAGYALWRFVRAALGHGPEGTDSSMDRVMALSSGLVYTGLFIVALKILFESGSGTLADADKTTAGVFGWPAGTWIVGIAGLVFIGVGLYQGYRGLSRDFLADSKTEEMSPGMKRWFGRIGALGYGARMVVSCLVGVFLIKAAIDFNAKAAVGLDGALAKLIHRSYGPYLLGIVAAGLIAFGLYSITDARYRRI
jgi:hypothetical protein